MIASGDLYELLSGAPSPRVKLPSRSKEPDFAWVPQDQLTFDAKPTAVLEVAVFHESEEEVLAEGHEWLSLPETQVSNSHSNIEAPTSVASRAKPDLLQHLRAHMQLRDELQVQILSLLLHMNVLHIPVFCMNVLKCSSLYCTQMVSGGLQVAFLVKIIDEINPPNDCPSI